MSGYFNTSTMPRPRTGIQILLAAATVLAVAGLCFPFSEHIGHRSVALILLLTVSVLAMRLSLAAVLSAAVLSALVWDYFFIPPLYTLHIEHAEDVLFMMMYFIVAVLNAIINRRLRQLEAVRQEKSERESALRLYNTLFSSLSHDLRTPVAAILGAADTLQGTDSQLSARQRERLLDTILAGSLHLSAQIENLLSMSRIEAGMIQPRKAWCDVGDLLRDALKKTSADASAHQVKMQVPDDFPLVQLDYGLTEHVLQNLLSNALTHTPAGTHITLSAHIESHQHGRFESDDGQSEHLRSVHTPTDHTLVLEVRDDGPGFAAEEMEQAFDKFYRPKGTRADGTGLGLFVARGFTEAQGGEISLRNLRPGGACFSIEMPTPILSQLHHE